MPFTLAHPAAAIPLVRPLKRYGVLSSLMIGSMTPDLAYLLPLRGFSAASHSLFGLFWFCLPMGSLTYIIFHSILKGPLLGLLPISVFAKLGSYAVRFQSLPPVSWLAVLVSLFFGALSHLVWDAFTHQGAVAVNLFPVLQSHLFSVGTYQVHLFKLLQHVSTGVGLVLMTYWSWHWLMKAPADNRPLPVMLSPISRNFVIAALVLIPSIAGAASGLSSFNPHDVDFNLQVFVGKVVFASIQTLLLTVVAYSTAWHLWNLFNRRPAV